MDRAFFFTDPQIHLLIQCYFFALGAVVGSFLNVCIYRIPLNESIVTPRSKCSGCGTPIPWYQNIPLLSYVFLRARCAFCGVRISSVYPMVELITGLFFLLLYRYFGISLVSLIYAVFGCAMIVLIYIDYFHKLLPAVITFPGVVLGLLSSFFNPFVTSRDSLFGLLIGGCLPALAMWIYKLVRKKEGLGHGDIVMLAMVGAFLGWQQVLLVLFASSLLGSFIGGGVILLLRKERDYMLPYGTFIGAAALPAVFWGQSVWHVYVGH
jgi:leader peptidase (prepilin peptidase)/N-methyltransferase